MTGREPLGVAILGFGTVGQAVARILCDGSHPSLRVTHVFNRQIARKRVDEDWMPSSAVWTDDIETVLASDTDIVVEVVGGVDPAAAWIRRALESGKSVVTANKQVIAHHGEELLLVAATHDQQLYFEAAVAGGIPIIRGVREGLAGDSLTRVLGILNGTCNYILTRMELDQVGFDEALTEAQALGFAEADPTADVDGFDAQAKLAILSAVALGRQVPVDDIPLRTIRSIEPVDFVYAHRLGCTIRQVARAELDGQGERVLASVQPTLVPTSSAVARVEGSRNVVVVEGKFGGETVFSGFGAGGAPTGVAVVSDLESIARGGGRGQSGGVRPERAALAREFVAPHYLRFVVSDRPGIIAELADVFSRHSVSIDSVLQEPGWSKAELPFVVTLEACGSLAVEETLEETARFDFNVRPPLWMPVMKSGDHRP